MCEAVAGSWLHFEHISGAKNPTDILTEPLSWHALKTFVEPLLVWKGDMVDAPPGDPNLEGSDKDLGCGTSWITNQSHAVMTNHGTEGAQNDAPHENLLAGMLISAMLSDNQCSVLLKK